MDARLSVTLARGTDEAPGARALLGKPAVVPMELSARISL
ncbi:hypothetical protein SAMN05444166_0487 [Singulisphaera sp. GP187]|nr:hypothetical protein SAMN05444166_0487 [Singulisphaera sp. GP187]